MQERKRFIDVEKLDPKQALEIADELGVAIRTMIDETIERANKLLAIYGMVAKMQVAIHKIGDEESEVQ